MSQLEGLSDKTTLIFDFDGTLADTLDVLYQAANHFAERYGYSPITSRGQLDYLRGLSARQIISLLEIPWRSLPRLTLDIRRYIQDDMTGVPLYPGIKDALYALRDKGYTLGVMTSNARKNVNICLNSNDCDIFEFICTSRFVLNKSRSLKRVLKRRGLNPKNTYYIGDESRDIDAAKKSGLQSVAVTWGFNNKEQLVSNKPYLVLDSPDDLNAVFPPLPDVKLT